MPGLAFLFLAHADEHVGDHHVGAGHGLRRIAGHLGGAEGRGGRAVPFRGGEAELEAEDGRGLAEGERHVRGAVADEGEGLALDGAELLLHREEVREDLHRMAAVGEAVDHRDARRAREGAQPVVAVRAEHDGVDVARGDARGVLERLAARDLALAGGEGDRAPAQLADGGLERDAGAGGGLLEEEQERSSAQRSAPPRPSAASP